ncbi:MAG: hypothetical protein H0T89_08230 [Deltaproteobacteria bacterium]|nr:hypothetical protein [Deltaproteobacteria bacterium]MDQ3295153.1 hypothetical protein [Myxococcota bacterium]
MDEASTVTCTFRRDAQGVVHAVMRAGCEMTLADAKENVAMIFALGSSQRSRVLVDMRGVRSQTRDARQYFAGAEAEKATLAVALLIGSPVSRVLANFFLRLSPQRIPTALFTDEEAAIVWLVEQQA